MNITNSLSTILLMLVFPDFSSSFRYMLDVAEYTFSLSSAHKTLLRFRDGSEILVDHQRKTFVEVSQ
jgi:hypothetical protein